MFSLSFLITFSYIIVTKNSGLKYNHKLMTTSFGKFQIIIHKHLYKETTTKISI